MLETLASDPSAARRLRCRFVARRSVARRVVRWSRYRYLAQHGPAKYDSMTWGLHLCRCGRIESKIVSGSMEGVRHCQRLGVERITDRCCLHGLERQRPAKPSVGYSVVRNVNLGRNHGAGYSARKSCTSSYWSNMPKTRQ